ncbi:MAG: phosphoenolpyruvate--protein phosphotransferase [Planctomycetes bacterium]|nr:phosphoenolpyruvate--protein phosphotransferase [Planctomycetota bacterium]
MSQTRTISGVPVAPGLAMAPVHVVRAAPEVIPTWSLRGDEVEREVERLEASLARVSHQLDEQRRLVAEGVSRQEAEIFSVHRMILQDPGALKRVTARIREERLNAEACVEHLIRHLESTMSKLEGNSVRNYGADISDPWRLVVRDLMQRDFDAISSSGDTVVLAAEELTPYVVTCLDRSRVQAIVTERGGRFSHGAVLARSFGFPTVVEIPNLLSRLEQGMRMIVDGDAGTIQLDPDQAAVDLFLTRHARHQAKREVLEQHAGLPAVTPDGHRLLVQVNIESTRDLEVGDFEPDHTDGVGLLRTEFLYMERTQFPSEEEQYRLYRRVVEHFEGRPVTLRTLDIGGDKQLPYFKTPKEVNPALGWRGLRVSLQWEDLLRIQLRAALRASGHGPVQLLLPMVTAVEEVRRVHQIFREVRSQLAEQGYRVADDVPAGIMVEVPAALLTLPQILEEVDFVSVGTNDLVQYLLAADRDNPWVAKLYDPYHPAVLWALRWVADAARAAGKPCSVCGEVGGDYATALMLLGMGYTSVSMGPNFLSTVRYAVRTTPFTEAVALAEEASGLGSGREVRRLLEDFRVRLHARQTGAAGSAAGSGPSKGSQSA